jgi:hypothetical protein
MITAAILSRVVPAGAIAVALVGSVWLIDHRADTRGYNRAEQQYKAQIADMKLSQAVDLQKAQRGEQTRRDAQSRNALRQSELLIAAKEKIDAQSKQLQERAPHVSTLYRQAPSAALQAVPDWLVTHGWVCDYNRATGDDLPAAAAGASGTEDPSCAADPFGPSAVSAERILLHHEEYGAYCRKLEEQRDRLIGHIEFIEGKPIQ